MWLKVNLSSSITLYKLLLSTSCLRTGLIIVSTSWGCWWEWNEMAYKGVWNDAYQVLSTVRFCPGADNICDQENFLPGPKEGTFQKQERVLCFLFFHLIKLECGILQVARQWGNLGPGRSSQKAIIKNRQMLTLKAQVVSGYFPPLQATMRPEISCHHALMASKNPFRNEHITQEE